MKKIITLLAVIGMFSLQGCTTTTETSFADNDTISTVFENKIPYNFTSSNNYIVRFVFPTPIYSSDMVLVYRLAGAVNGKDLWEFLPETYYFANGTRDFSYNFNFTNSFVDIYLNGNDLISVPSTNRLSQIFRIVVVPADIVYAIDKSNFEAVMEASKMNESQIQKINF